ncbi:hypothetical protein SLS55_009002 [Diplodia seriata]|uniref:Uncharacterized protein n=1 Tax=Diplodia seriata TaxID=420778 RepID=A0A1S8BGX4_9PEZI|nr:hypothetical protein BK809_0003713 [Diplodia seriata]
MRNTVLALSALAGTALSNPLVTGLDFAQINDVVATAITTGAPIVASATSSYVGASAIDAASAAATVAVSAAVKVKRHFYTSTSTTSCTTSTSTSSSSASTSVVAVTTSTSTSAAAAVVLPTSTSLFCTSLATGAGPIPTPDSASAFQAYAPFHASATAQAAAAALPTNYDLSFTDLGGATQLSTYLTYKTLASYSAKDCAAFCDATALCTGFNIYFERDPTMDGNTGACLDAALASTTNIKCALFGGSVSAASATNAGQYRNAFQVVVAGSNGYSKKAAAVSPPDCNAGSANAGWKAGQTCRGSGVMVRAGALVGQRFFAGPYNPAQCAAYAEAQTAKNKAAAGWWSLFRYQPCNSFNAVALVKNGRSVGTYCSLFNVDVSAQTCSYAGGRSGADSFEVSLSHNYACKNYDNGNLLW